MSMTILIDNWTLQNAGDLMHGQRRGEAADELDVDASVDTTRYQPISQDVVAISCLCQLIQHIVLADGIVADEGFSESWMDLPSITALRKQELLSARDFRSYEPLWVPRREMMADQLSECAPGIRRQHEANKREYALNQKSSDGMLAQVLWGAAGMLARAELTRIPYTPHPLRERLLLRSRFLGAVPNARHHLMKFVDGEQMRLYQRAQIDGVYGTLRLPPIMVQVINESATLSQLIPTAIELRAEYAELRGWLDELQKALNAEDLQEVLSRRKVLQQVSANVDQFTSGHDTSGVTTIQLGIDFQPKATVDVRASKLAIQNRFGVQAQVNRLVLEQPGRNAFRRLLRLLGEENTARGLALERDFCAFQAR